MLVGFRLRSASRFGFAQKQLGEKVSHGIFDPFLAASIDHAAQKQIEAHYNGIAGGGAVQPFTQGGSCHHGDEPQCQGTQHKENDAQGQDREQFGQLADSIDLEAFGAQFEVAVKVGQQLRDGVDVIVG